MESSCGSSRTHGQAIAEQMYKERMKLEHEAVEADLGKTTDAHDESVREEQVMEP